MNLKGYVPILFNEITEDAKKDEIDVLAQVDAVASALGKLDFQTSKIPFSENTIGAVIDIKKSKPFKVFNLVESVSGNERLSYLAPSILESLNIKYTGCSAKGIFLTADKIITKKILKSCDIPTPSWFTESEENSFVKGDKYIIKRVYEDGSMDLYQESVLNIDNISQGRKVLRDKYKKSNNSYFAEKFIEGREINISGMTVDGKPFLLPPLEIKFIGYKENNRYEIQDYKSKWESIDHDADSIIATNEFQEEDNALIGVLKKISIRCWKEFELNGYFRVDFRIDDQGNPWVLEINANPCITPGESSFAKSAEYAGLNYDEMIFKILLE